MPPEVIARIATTAAHAEPRLGWHGDRLRFEADRLDWRAAIVEADLSDPPRRGSFDFLDRAGLLGLAGLAGLVRAGGRWLTAPGTAGDIANMAGDVAQAVLSPRAFRLAPFRQMWHLAGNRGGSQAVAFARYAIRYSSLPGKAVGRVGNVKVSPEMVGRLGKGLRVVGRGAKVIGAGFTFHDVYQERRQMGQSRTEAASAGIVVAGSSLTFAGAFGVAGTLVGGPVVGVALGLVGAFVGEQVGHGLLRASDNLSDALVQPYMAASEAINDLGTTASDAASGAADALGDVADDAGALLGKVKFW
jgi:hypothetical protein